MSHKSWTTKLDQPAPGVDWSFIPSNSDWSRLLAITATLTTDDTDVVRSAAVTVVDETGNLLTVDVPAGGAQNSSTFLYSWRAGSLYYGLGATPPTLTGSLPAFWLPAGATVAARTGNLDPPAGAIQAFFITADESSLLPVTIVVNVNDKISWAGVGGTGPPADYVIAPGVYTTIAQVAAAISAAVAPGPIVFNTRATVAAHAGSTYLITAVSDVGDAGNGDLIAAGSAHDAYASIFTESPPIVLNGGDNADGGDQWSSIVATYVTADARHWLTLEAMIDQLAAAR